MQVVVATHGHCFDGLVSAVLFTQLHKRLRGGGEFTYFACGYGPGRRTVDSLFTGDENALLDYRFSRSPKLTWFFDHHRTGICGAEEAQEVARGHALGRFFFAPDHSSCARLVAEVSEKHFGIDLELPELVKWADRIDSARFASAEEAVQREDPVQRLAAVVEHRAGDEFLASMVTQLLERPLEEVAGSKEIKALFRPLRLRRNRYAKRVRKTAQHMGRVVLVDLTETPGETTEKFVTYALFPEAVYSVVVGCNKSDVCIQVGYNPWSGTPLDTDISAICSRHGGGGHSVVGAISMAPTEVLRAKELAQSIARELAEPPAMKDPGSCDLA